MKYLSHSTDERPSRIGVLLVNLGTPDAPEPAALRRYLGEFLWDPRVVEMARVPWWLILHGIILRTRPARSAAAYRKVWGPEGSPLLVMSQKLGSQLRQRLEGEPLGYAVAVAMRYGNPSLEAGLEELEAQGVDRLLVLPLYPQYAAATTASIFDQLTLLLRRWRRIPELRFVHQYYTEDAYIGALADGVRRHQEQQGQPERLLISFHGIPLRYAEAGDPYPRQCAATAEALAQALGLSGDEWQLSFQSRFGREEWLRPYTDETLKAWGKERLGHVQVICPGFAVDCLETIEEIGEENRDYFLAAGGGRFGYIPALNDDPQHLDLLLGLVKRHCCGW